MVAHESLSYYLHYALHPENTDKYVLERVLAGLKSETLYSISCVVFAPGINSPHTSYLLYMKLINRNVIMPKCILNIISVDEVVKMWVHFTGKSGKMYISLENQVKCTFHWRIR